MNMFNIFMSRTSYFVLVNLVSPLLQFQNKTITTQTIEVLLCKITRQNRLNVVYRIDTMFNMTYNGIGWLERSSIDSCSSRRYPSDDAARRVDVTNDRSSSRNRPSRERKVIGGKKDGTVGRGGRPAALRSAVTEGQKSRLLVCDAATRKRRQASRRSSSTEAPVSSGTGSKF